MSDSVISVENLSKRYLVGHQGPSERYHSLRDSLVRHGRNFARKTFDMVRGRQIVQGDEVEEFWALKDVSFEVKRGEVLGIIGRNGAGKSTLLKILSRITEPTEGRVTLRGRVASLLEVGTGFHPELTGRENIFLNGAILGMSRAEIRKKFDEIVDFAEVEKFLDTPVKRYSSGMYVRLAFAVAAHLEPEILVVDEVLAVGDAEFQKKCLGKMEDVSKGGRTVLFVSHNTGMLSKICKTGILMKSGRLQQQGEIHNLIEDYLAAPIDRQANRFTSTQLNTGSAVFIREAETINEDNESKMEFSHETPVHLNIRCDLNCSDAEALESIRLSVALIDRLGRKVFTTQTPIPLDCLGRETFLAKVSIPSGVLTPSSYQFIINANIPPSTILHRIEGVCEFRVSDAGTEFAMFKGGDFGCVFVKCDWQVAPIETQYHSEMHRII